MGAGAVGTITADFPAQTLYPERVLYRIHKTMYDPVHFASHKEGRFNLTGLPGAGTCSLSASPIGAYVEKFGRFSTISTEDVVGRPPDGSQRWHDGPVDRGWVTGSKIR
jgi:hypothetical protein